jgi:hypothetical protein
MKIPKVFLQALSIRLLRDSIDTHHCVTSKSVICPSQGVPIDVVRQ